MKFLFTLVIGIINKYSTYTYISTGGTHGKLFFFVGLYGRTPWGDVKGGGFS
jgi:hypothetical protein